MVISGLLLLLLLLFLVTDWHSLIVLISRLFELSSGYRSFYGAVGFGDSSILSSYLKAIRILFFWCFFFNCSKNVF